MEEYQLKGKVILTGKIKVKTGLAIGGSKTSLDIGGVDNPVIKDSKGIPYIPGSTIKGKLRSLLEQNYYPLRTEDKNDGNGFFDPKMVIHNFEDDTVDDIIKIFGAPEVNEPGRGIFRDSFLDEAFFEENKDLFFKNLELDYTEDKIENTVDRISARANPRHLERVPVEAQFDFEIILDLFSEKDKELIEVLFQGLKLLEDDYLGGSGSRGSGKISFEEIKMILRDNNYYTHEKAETFLAENFNLKDVENKDWFVNVYNKISL